ncbi:MAG: YdcH family protein [Henriciella sp.]|nr:YdcH family protein [Henriciella sp.]
MPELDRWENEGGAVTPKRPTARLRTLERHHNQLEAKVQAEQKRPNPCAIELQRLKREKLYLKDQIRQMGS